MAERRVQQSFKGMPEEQIREFAIYGTSDDILKQIGELEDVGLQYLIVDLEPYREIEALEIFADKIIKHQ
jgi:alkanesulfonate monooxygenase SsuD/methylene tetrahydromethanopterin reductase-like flavin-dependent oxidoreductase (luciferase family)